MNKPTKSTLSNEIAFFVCVAGIYISYLIFGIFQEQLSVTRFGPEQKRFKNTFFLLFVQCFVDAIGAWALIKIWKLPKDLTPVTKYVPIAFTYVSAMFCSNYAIQFVNFPTMVILFCFVSVTMDQVLAKSCKPIPVMLVGIVVSGKRYPLMKYFCVLLITGGISLFMFEGGGHDKGGAELSSFGLLLLGVSLLLDGATGPLQDNLFKSEYSPLPTYMMYYGNLFATIFVGVALIVTGQGLHGIQFCLEFPEIIPQLLLFAISSGIGQTFIYLTLRKFGSLACSLVTTTRKFFTILLSVLLFGNEITDAQWIGVVIVFIGLGLDMYLSKTSGHAKAH